MASGASVSPDLGDGFFVVDGVALHYVTSGNGSLIIFLHGFPEFWYQWRNQLVEFSRDHFAVALDMRGYNLSDKPRDVGRYVLRSLLEDVEGLARHLGYEKFVLVGHDWGGLVAWAFAIAQPEQVEKLVIVNAPHPGVFFHLLRDDEEQQRASQYMLIFQGVKAEDVLSANNYAVLEKLLLDPLLNEGYFTATDCEAYLKAWSQPGALTGALNYYRASELGPMVVSDRKRELPGFFTLPLSQLTVEVPVMVIWGEKDIALVPRNLDWLDQCVPNLTVKRFPEATHWVIHEKSAEVNGCIREFLAR